MSTTTTRTALAVAIVAILVGSALMIGTTAQETGPSQDTAYMRVVHASPDAPAVDVYIDGETALTDFEFAQVSDYLALPEGDYTVTITPAGDNETIVFEGEVDLDAREAVTLAATGEVSEDAETEFEPAIFGDGAFAPGANTSAVRVVHLSPDAPAVDVTTANGSVVLADNLTFRDESDYMNVPAGDYTVEIREETDDNNGTVVATANVSLDEETVYSAWAVGYFDPEDAPVDNATAFAVGTTIDAQTTITLPVPAVTEEPTTETPGETTEEEMTETPEEETEEEMTETPEEETTEAMNETAEETPA